MVLSDSGSSEPPPSREHPGDMASLRSAALTTSSPLALINPAKSHPEVIVQAVSARDRQKAEAFAKSYGIPEVKDSYQGES